MTREEAIEVISQDIPCEHDADLIEALKMAIKALEQEPCEDAISREKAKQFLYERLDRLNDDELYDIFSRIIDDMYNELTPVTPQPKTGYWIRGHHGFGCSNCHKSIEGEWDDNIDDITGTLFCPNCGAKMIEPQEKRCADCNHYGKLSLDCGRCDDDCSMFEPKESEERE